MFPTSVVESLRVQKSWSPEQTANFGGGSVDIRTKGIPDGFTVKVEAGLGVNSENPSNILTYNGGGDDSYGTDDGTRALSPGISNALVTYQGALDPQSILNVLQRTNPDATIADAQAINRDLALQLNRDIGVRDSSTDPDYKLRASVGNNYEIEDLNSRTGTSVAARRIRRHRLQSGDQIVMGGTVLESATSGPTGQATLTVATGGVPIDGYFTAAKAKRARSKKKAKGPPKPWRAYRTPEAAEASIAQLRRQIEGVNRGGDDLKST